jgi:transcriptional regulator with XRE-family HTH domain
MDINQLTAERIKEIRTSLGITAKSVSNKLGIAESNYSQMENGKVQITLNRLEIIANIFNVPVDSLIVSERSNQTINISHGDHSICATNVNNYSDKEITDALKQTINMLSKIINKTSVTK